MYWPISFFHPWMIRLWVNCLSFFPKSCCSFYPLNMEWVNLVRAIIRFQFVSFFVVGAQKSRKSGRETNNDRSKAKMEKRKRKGTKKVTFLKLSFDPFNFHTISAPILFFFHSSFPSFSLLHRKPKRLKVRLSIRINYNWKCIYSFQKVIATVEFRKQCFYSQTPCTS